MAFKAELRVSQFSFLYDVLMVKIGVDEPAAKTLSSGIV